MTETSKSKLDWQNRVDEISGNRSWEEIVDHFRKHLREMSRLDSEKEQDRAVDKAYSLVDLCAFAVRKMGVPECFFDLFDSFSHKKLLERIEVHEILLQSQKLEEEEKKKREKERRLEYQRLHVDDNSDTD